MSTRPWDAALMAQARTRLRGLDAGEAASIVSPRLSGWFKVAEGDGPGPFRGSNARWLRAWVKLDHGCVTVQKCIASGDTAGPSIVPGSRPLFPPAVTHRPLLSAPTAAID